MTAVRTLTVIESDSLTKSIDEEYPNPTKAKNAFTIVRLRRHTFPQPTLYLSTQWTKTYESNWVAVESPRLMRVPAGTYILKDDGTVECTLSGSSPVSLERKNSGDLETIEEEPFNNAEIPGLIEACSQYVVSYEARNPGSQHDAAVIEDYYHAPRLRTQHRRTASQASSSRQSSQSPPSQKT